MGSKKKQRNAAIEEEGHTPGLPCEIIYSILSRLPVKSLLRFRCVCKSWLLLISGSDFMKTHLNESIKLDRQKLLFRPVTISDCFYSIDFEISDNSNEKLYLPHNQKNRLLDIYCSCNGLVLLGLDYTETLVLWNPSTRVSRKFSSPFSISIGTFCGLCYDSTIDDYKVVLVSNSFIYVVFSFETNSWTKPRKFTYIPVYCDTHFPFNKPLYSESGVNVNGVFHFIAKSSNYLSSDSGTDSNSASGSSSSDPSSSSSTSSEDVNECRYSSSDHSSSEISSSSSTPYSSSSEDDNEGHYSGLNEGHYSGLNKGHYSGLNKSYSSSDGDGDGDGHCRASSDSDSDSDSDGDGDVDGDGHCRALFPSMQDSADNMPPHECDSITAYASIVFFNAVNEMFEEMSPPICINKRDAFGLIVVKGCLGLYCSRPDGKQAEVWVMKEHGEMNSWAKLFIIRYRLQRRFLKTYLRPLYVLKNGEIVMAMGEKNIVIYNPKGNKVRNLVTPNMGYFKVVSFVDSLVLPTVE